MLMPLGKTAAPGEFVTALMVTPFEFVDEFEAKCPSSPPTRAATSKSEIRVDQGARLERTWEDSGAASVTGALGGAGTGRGCSSSGGAAFGSIESVGPFVTWPC